MLYWFRCFSVSPMSRASQINRIPRALASIMPSIPVPDRSLETERKRLKRTGTPNVSLATERYRHMATECAARGAQTW